MDISIAKNKFFLKKITYLMNPIISKEIMNNSYNSNNSKNLISIKIKPPLLIFQTILQISIRIILNLKIIINLHKIRFIPKIK